MADEPDRDRRLRDLILSLQWHRAKAEGKMREKQEEGTDAQHSRLREGRYEGLCKAAEVAQFFYEEETGEKPPVTV